MKVVVLTPRSLAPVSRSIIEALKNRGATVMKLAPARVALDLNNGEPDMVKKYFTGGEPRGAIVRGIGTSKTKKIYTRLGVLSIFEECGTYLLNSRACLEVATNKALTSCKLIKHGVPTPRTILCEGFKAATEAYKNLGGDVVLKPLYGSKGIGIMRLTDEGFASNIFYNLDRLDEVFYIQRYVEHGNHDLRAMVLGDEVICSMKRINTTDLAQPWKTNVAIGAHGHSIDLSPELKEIAVKSAKAVGGEFIGVDIAETKDGPMVIEVNSVPGFSELQKTTSIDIAGRLADYFLAKLKR
ncbi:MAG: RimK family alpha-L-glutamate ligase [Candidatus Lokiarchaeota archaeon]|nr:RimK family alpha-L-glutamate ligase [Candidatus Lokiarchaeota archaeon]